MVGSNGSLVCLKSASASGSLAGGGVAQPASAQRTPASDRSQVAYRSEAPIRIPSRSQRKANAALRHHPDEIGRVLAKARCVCSEVPSPGVDRRVAMERLPPVCPPHPLGGFRGYDAPRRHLHLDKRYVRLRDQECPMIQPRMTLARLQPLERWLTGPRFARAARRHRTRPAPALSFEFFPPRPRRWRCSLGLHPPAGAAAAAFRVGHLRRRRQHRARTHATVSRLLDGDQPRAGGASDLRRRDPGGGG